MRLRGQLVLALLPLVLPGAAGETDELVTKPLASGAAGSLPSFLDALSPGVLQQLVRIYSGAALGEIVAARVVRLIRDKGDEQRAPLHDRVRDIVNDRRYLDQAADFMRAVEEKLVHYESNPPSDDQLNKDMIGAAFKSQERRRSYLQRCDDVERVQRKLVDSASWENFSYTTGGVVTGVVGAGATYAIATAATGGAFPVVVAAGATIGGSASFFASEAEPVVPAAEAKERCLRTSVNDFRHIYVDMMMDVLYERTIPHGTKVRLCDMLEKDMGPLGPCKALRDGSL